MVVFFISIVLCHSCYVKYSTWATNMWYEVDITCWCSTSKSTSLVIAHFASSCVISSFSVCFCLPCFCFATKVDYGWFLHHLWLTAAMTQLSLFFSSACCRQAAGCSKHSVYGLLSLGASALKWGQQIQKVQFKCWTSVPKLDHSREMDFSVLAIVYGSVISLESPRSMCVQG